MNGCPWRRRRSPRGPRCDGQRGTVTAETAVALPVLVAAAGVALELVLLGTTQLRSVDAAREAARAAARGEPTAVVRRVAREAAPAGARVEVRPGGGTVTVEVAATVAPLGPLARRLATVTVRARAVAAVEPGVGG